MKQTLFTFLISLFLLMACTNKQSSEGMFYVANDSVSKTATFDTIVNKDSIPLLGRDRYFSPSDSVACNQLEPENGNGEECIIKNATIILVYKNILEDQLVEDFQYLLPVLPSSDRKIKIFKNDSKLMNIIYSYKAKEQLTILLEYESYEKIITLMQVGKDVKRGMFTFQDAFRK